MRNITSAVVGLVLLGVVASQASTAAAAPNAKACDAGVTLDAVASGSSVTVSVSPPVNLKPAKDGDADSFHLHYFVDTDPASVLQPGQAVPSGNPKIVHSAAITQDFKDLTPGSHQIWVVLGDVGHIPCDPLVTDNVAITVAAAPVAAPATGTGDALAGDDRALWLPLATLAVGALALAAGALTLRRRAQRTP